MQLLHDNCCIRADEVPKSLRFAFVDFVIENAIKSDARSQVGELSLSFISIPAFKLLQTHLQLLQRRVQPALHGAQRQIERICNLAKCQFFKLFHHHHLPQLDWQAVYRRRTAAFPAGLRRRAPASS
jgi:hypothetical protein